MKSSANPRNSPSCPSQQNNAFFAWTILKYQQHRSGEDNSRDTLARVGYHLLFSHPCLPNICPNLVCHGIDIVPIRAMRSPFVQLAHSIVIWGQRWAPITMLSHLPPFPRVRAVRFFRLSLIYCSSNHAPPTPFDPEDNTTKWILKPDF